VNCIVPNDPSPLLAALISVQTSYTAMVAAVQAQLLNPKYRLDAALGPSWRQNDADEVRTRGFPSPHMAGLSVFLAAGA